MSRAWRSTIRTSAFLRKELVEILRQPRLVIALVLAPFLILLLFGAGLKDSDPLVNTIFVVPPDDTLAEEVERFATEPSWRLRVESITSDEDEALARLEREETDLVVVFPSDAVETVRSNRRAKVVIYHNLVDPIESRALGLATRAAVDRLNQQVLRSVVAEGQTRVEDAHERLERAQDRVTALQRALDEEDETAARLQLALLESDVGAVSQRLPNETVLQNLAPDAEIPFPSVDEIGAELVDHLDELSAAEDVSDIDEDDLDEVARRLDRMNRLLDEFQGLSPEVVVNPFIGQMRRLADTDVQLTDFFAPGVVVLLVQHLLVTLVALSVVRDEELGTTELFRVAPLTTREFLLGKYLSFLVLSAAVTAVLMALLFFGLGVPLAGSWVVLVGSLAALLFTSIGLGFVIALFARNDSQAVQYAMMVLLASIFLTGFLITLDRVIPLLETVAWLLPATYGIELLRGVMLRGIGPQPTVLLGLVGIGVLLLAVSWFLLRRRLEPAGARHRARAARRPGGDT